MLLDTVLIGAALGGDAQETLGAKDSTCAAVFFGPAAPRDQLRAEEGILAGAQGLGGLPVRERSDMER